MLDQLELDLHIIHDYVCTNVFCGKIYIRND